MHDKEDECAKGKGYTHAFITLDLACASLIGQAICFELSKQGANLALTDPSRGAGQELCRELHKSGHTASLLFAAIDYKDLEKLSTYIRSASKTLKKLDCLVNCATFAPEVSLSAIPHVMFADSIIQEGMMHRSKGPEVADIFDYNLRTTWAATQAAVTQFELQNDNKLQCPKGGYSIV